MSTIYGLCHFRQLFAALLLFIGCSSVSYAEWTRINPGGGGAFTSVGVGPSGLVIATSDLGGAYISHDDGASWETIGARKGMTMTHVQSVAFHPSDDKTVLISGDSETGVNETGLSFSDDEACHFTPAEFSPSLPRGATVKSVAFSPSQSNVVYASVRSQLNLADSKIYRSVDHGRSFEMAANHFPEADILGNPIQLAITKLIVHPDNPDLVLALSRPDRFVESASKGLFITKDGGDNWQQIAEERTDISDVVFHPLAPFPVYLADLIDGYFYSEDIEIENVQSWVNINSTIDTQGVLWPSAENSLQIRIIDTDVSWFVDATEVAWQISSHDNGLADSWVTEPLATNRDWTGQDENSWEAGWSKVPFIFNPPLGGELSKAIGYDLSYQSNPDRIFWVTQQFAFKGYFSKSPLPQLDFEPAHTRKGAPTFLKNPVLPEHPDIPEGLTDNNWQSTGIDNITATLIDVNANDPDTVYIGLQDVGCFVSRDGGAFWKSCNFLHFNGQSWQGIDDKAYGGSVYALLSDPENPARVWMASSPGQRNPDHVNETDRADEADGLVRLLYSNDYGETWSTGKGLPDSADIYGLSLDPTDANHQTLYVTVSGYIYQTKDGGENWLLFPSDCDEGCRVTAVDPDGNIYAGGESGFFYLIAGVAPTSTSAWNKLVAEFPESDGSFHSENWRGISAIEPGLREYSDVFVTILQSAEHNADHRGGIYRCRLAAVDTSIQFEPNQKGPRKSNFSRQPCAQLLGSDNADSDLYLPGSFMRDLAIDPSRPDIIYATSSSAYTSGGYHKESVGVLRSTDYGVSWKYVNNGLEWPLAVPVSISPADPDVVYIGSPGPGFYKRDFSNKD